MSFKITGDTLTPGLRAMAARCRNKKPILFAMGSALVFLTKRAFHDESVRASTWAQLKKRVGSPLLKSTLLSKSPRIIETTNEHVIVGTDRPYAKYHQFGTKHIPARPFFPFDSSGKPIPVAIRNIQLAAAAAMRKLLKD